MGMAGQYHLPGPKPFPPARNIAWGNLDEAYCWRKQGTFKGSMGRPLREDFRGFLGHHRTTPLRISILCSSRICLKQHFNSTSVFSFWKTNEQWKRTWLFKGTYGILLPSYIYIYIGIMIGHCQDSYSPNTISRKIRPFCFVALFWLENSTPKKASKWWKTHQSLKMFLLANTCLRWFWPTIKNASKGRYQLHSYIFLWFCSGGVLHLVSQKSDRVFKEGATIFL